MVYVHTLHVSFPIPEFPPVTMIVWPVRSGTFSLVQCGLGGNTSLNVPTEPSANGSLLQGMPLDRRTLDRNDTECYDERTKDSGVSLDDG